MSLGIGVRSLAAVGMTAAALMTATAASGQIVYDHGPDIWVMNDDGSNQHSLLTVGQVPGMTQIGDPRVFPNGGTKVTFDATTNVNQAPSNSGPPGACGLNCTGVYTDVNGAVTRLTAAPAPCGASQQWCTSFSTSPAWMANGNIAYERSVYAWDYSCITLPCTWQFYPGWVDEVDQIPPTVGAGAGTKFPYSNTGTGDTLTPVPDPADATKIAYIGATVGCATTCQYPLYISTGSGADTPVVYDDVLKEAAWSPDGNTFADIEGGDKRGIWTYAANAATTTGKQFVWALQDPIQTGNDPGNNPFDASFENVGWIGTSKIIFRVENNLWTIPASCGQNGTPCQFPGDATQLTHDGTAQSPDGSASWTSSTSSLSGSNGNNGNNGGSGGSFKVTAQASSSQRVLANKGLTETISCNQACAFAAAGGLQIKGSRKTLLAKGATGTVSANGTKAVTLKLSSKELKAIKKALHHGKRVTAQVVVVAENSARHKQQASATFTVHH